MQYIYPDGANIGKVCRTVDVVTNEQVSYGYDAWNRLSAATAYSGAGPSTGCTSAGSVVWGYAYGYDGYGNLTDKTPTAGSLTPLHVVADPATNRIAPLDNEPDCSFG